MKIINKKRTIRKGSHIMIIEKITVKEFPRSVKLIVDKRTMFRAKKTKDNRSEALNMVKARAFDIMYLHREYNQAVRYELKFEPEIKEKVYGRGKS